MIDLERIDFEEGGGLVAVVCQDELSGAVLMVAHANRESMERTLETGEMHYWSRSRGLWRKGSTSGNRQQVSSLRYDCDADAILARVRPSGPACHTGSASCFGTIGETAGVLARLDSVIRERAVAAGVDNVEAKNRPNREYASDIESSPERAPRSENSAQEPSADHRNVSSDITSATSYTLRLLLDRNLRLKKIGEEAAELVTACADGDRDRVCEEAADLIYHTLVVLHASGASLRDVERVLARRDKAAPR